MNQLYQKTAHIQAVKASIVISWEFQCDIIPQKERSSLAIKWPRPTKGNEIESEFSAFRYIQLNQSNR